MTCPRIATAILSLLFLASGVLCSTPGVDAGGVGRIVGTVKLAGPAPKPKVIDLSKDPACAEARGNAPATTENVVAGAGGGLANVVVYISQGLTGNEAASTQVVTMNQKGCQYVPHVVALNVGQHLAFTNSDKTYHNIHPDPNPDGRNRPWNKSQMPGAPPLDVTWANEEVAIPVKCNVHPWMRGFIAVVRGPSGVSDRSGSFKLDNVAPGTYALSAWQEAYGTQTQTVTVAAGKAAIADFTFKGK